MFGGKDDLFRRNPHVSFAAESGVGAGPITLCSAAWVPKCPINGAAGRRWKRRRATLPRDWAVLVRERAGWLVWPDEREADRLARAFFHAARAVEVVESRSGETGARRMVALLVDGLQYTARPSVNTLS